ncbi:MAG: translation initiation factor eIF-2B [bacterium]
MSDYYKKLLEKVKEDNSSGAWVIAQKTIDCLEALTQEKSNDDFSDLISEVERVIGETLKAQPNMSQLTNLFNEILFTIENETSQDTLVMSRKIAGEAQRFEEISKKAVAKVAELGAELIPSDGVVLTHSNSSTIMEIIKRAQAANKSFQVILTESRPVCEGRERAFELSKIGIPTLYVIDAAFGMGVERADVILLGVDSVSETTLVNKIGTKAICLLAREAVVPCYAACESSKFMSQKLSPKKEPLRDPIEVWGDPPPETSIENYYFDETPLELFTGVITEVGILTPEEVGSKISAHKMNSRLIQMLK